MTWKLYETEILVSINKILLAHYVHSVKYMSTFALQVAEFIVSRDGNGLQILKYFTVWSFIEEVYQPLTQNYYLFMYHGVFVCLGGGGVSASLSLPVFPILIRQTNESLLANVLHSLDLCGQRRRLKTIDIMFYIIITVPVF